MRKKILTLTTAGFMVVVMSMTAFAGEWIVDNIGLRYQKDDGSFMVSDWWHDPDTGKYFYLDANGYRLVNSITPDGYRVIENGSWDGRPAVKNAGSTDENAESAVENAGSAVDNGVDPALESPFRLYNDVEIDTYDTEHQVEALKKLYKRCSEVVPHTNLRTYDELYPEVDLMLFTNFGLTNSKFDVAVFSEAGIYYHVRASLSNYWSDQYAYGKPDAYQWMPDIDYATLRILLGENEGTKVYQLLKAYGDPKKVGGYMTVKTSVPSKMTDSFDIEYTNPELDGKYEKIGASRANGDGTYNTGVYSSTALVGDGIANLPTITGITDYGMAYRVSQDYSYGEGIDIIVGNDAEYHGFKSVTEHNEMIKHL